MDASADRRPIIMDVDTGVDDAAAIMLATRLSSLDLIGVSTVAGNVSLDHTTENTLRVLAAVGRPDIPVFRGMSSPLIRPLRDASHFHGVNGLGDVELPPSSASAQSVTAPEFIVRSARERPGELSLVFVGPLTNLAVTLSLEPALPKLVRRVVVMGGAFLATGNVTPFAEFNIWADPEAAAAVVRTDLPLTFIGLDVTHQTLFSRHDWEQLEQANGLEARLIASLFRRTFVDRQAAAFPLHDPLAVGVTHQSDIVETERFGIVVETGLGDTVGQTLLVKGDNRPAHEVALGVNVEQFLSLFRQRLSLG